MSTITDEIAAGVAVAKPYGARGGARKLWATRAPEVLLAGPSGTGKSRACLEKLNFLALKYAGMRGLIVRKTRESLTHSGLVTLERDVVVPGQALWLAHKTQWRYRNGSRLVVGGMDKVGKVMSSEYQVIYVMEATELTEDEWEHLLTRLRGEAMPYCQLIACCNPAGPNHWLLRRQAAGKLVLLESRHEDNPLLYANGAYTTFGSDYLAKLDSLTGVRYQRLRLGRWVQAEGMVYDEFDANLHLVKRFSPPPEWRRIWSIDFGFTHPLVFQAWAVDPEGRLYRFAELYHSQLLVEDAAHLILAWMARSGEDFPEALICDHDAEGRATLKAKLGLASVAAKKSVALGIQAVKQRLRVAADGRPRLFLMRDVGIKTDRALDEARQPNCTEQEVELYVWQDGVRDSVPVKAYDDGMDALRYAVMYVDKRGWSLEQIAAWGRGESSVKTPASSPPPEEPEPQPKPREPQKPAETPEEKQRRRDEEVAEMNRQALLRAQGHIR